MFRDTFPKKIKKTRIVFTMIVIIMESFTFYAWSLLAFKRQKKYHNFYISKFSFALNYVCINNHFFKWFCKKYMGSLKINNATILNINIL